MTEMFNAASPGAQSQSAGQRVADTPWKQQLKTAVLVLADGTVIEGYGIGATGSAVGEVCFNTAMSGYQEILTDPSYARQLLVLTYPLIGNYGVPADEYDSFSLHRWFESERIQAAALVVSELCDEYSHWAATRSLDDWLAENKIPGIYGKPLDPPALCQSRFY